MKSMLLHFWLVAVLGCTPVGKLSLAAEPITLKLWPDGPPTAMTPKSAATAKLLQSFGGAGPNRITDVTDPTITVYKPETPKHFDHSRARGRLHVSVVRS